MRHFILTNSDGTIQIMHLLLPDAKPEDEIAKMPEDNRKQIKSWREVSMDEVSKVVAQRQGQKPV